MVQTTPSYPFMTSKTNKTISDRLVKKYGYNNVVWPIAWCPENKVIWYTYERLEICAVNHKDDNRPTSNKDVKNYFLDYTTNPRQIIPDNSNLKDAIDVKYSCSYDYVVNSPYSTIDINYAWYKTDHWRGIDITTFWKEFKDRNIVEDLIIKMNRRPSWKGTKGTHGILKQIDVCDDLNIDYYMVGVNTIGGVSNDFKEDGNIFRFKLTRNAINNIICNRLPDNLIVESFSDFLNWL